MSSSSVAPRKVAFAGAILKEFVLAKFKSAVLPSW